MYPDKIFLIGFMGVGKSHWGSKLAQALEYHFIDLDDEISKKAGGRTIAEIFDQEGEAFFRELEAHCLITLTDSKQHMVVACGGGTPCFLNNMDRMKKAGRVIWLQAQPQELIPRLLAERKERPLIRDLDGDLLESYIIRKMGDRRQYYQQAHRWIEESELTESNFIQTLLHE